MSLDLTYANEIKSSRIGVDRLREKGENQHLAQLREDINPP